MTFLVSRRSDSASPFIRPSLDLAALALQVGGHVFKLSRQVATQDGLERQLAPLHGFFLVIHGVLG